MPEAPSHGRRVQKLIAEPETRALLRGEVWVDPGVLAAAGFDSGPAGLVAFAVANNADLCFFPGQEAGCHVPLEGMAMLAHEADLDCGVVVDGPFQRLATEGSLLSLLGQIGRDPGHFAAALNRHMEEVRSAVGRAAKAGFDILLLTDDLAYAGGLYFSPDLFHRCLLPLYRDLIQRFSRDGLHWGWHSDGRVATILPGLAAAGFRIFSLEAECVDLAAFKRAHRDRLCLGGIRAGWLADEHFDWEVRQTCVNEIAALVREGGILLASSCGIHNPALLKNLREIYRISDEWRMGPAEKVWLD